MTRPLVTKTDIENYLPHRPPVIMVDTLWSCGDGEVVAGFEVLPENIFVENAVLREPGILENVAQTAALSGGYGFRQSGEAVRIGYIGAFKDVRLHRLPAVGETLTTTLRELQSIWNCTSYHASVDSGGEVVASMEIKLFVL